MKYAICAHDEQVFQHFGKCPGFRMVEMEHGKVISITDISSNGNGHSALVNFLKEQNVDVVVCGGIGDGARSALKEHNIQLISGAKGHLDIIINKLSKGTLTDDPSGKCDHHHDEHDGCGEHICK